MNKESVIQETPLPLAQKRNHALDVSRVIAAMAVVMIHTCATIMMQYDKNGAYFAWANIFDSISRIGVPFFIMISGALMLNEDKPVSNKKLFGKKIPQLALILLFWSALYAIIYYVGFPIIKGGEVNIRQLIRAFMMGHHHLWYLYMTVGLYIAVPFLRSFVKRENKRLVLLFIAVSLTVRFTAPLLNMLAPHWYYAGQISELLSMFKLGFFGEYITYFLTGWYIVNVGIEKRKTRSVIYLSSLCSLILTALYVGLSKDYVNGYAEHSLLIFAYSVGVFLLINDLGGKMSEKTASGFEKLSKYSFGIYVTHALVLTVFEEFLPKLITFPPLYIIACFVCVYAVSLFAVFVTSKIPLIKKAVRT